MPSFFSAKTDRAFDRILLARHAALSLGAVAAYVFRTELRIGYLALVIVGVSATLNFLAYVFRSRPALKSFCNVASPIIGVGSWTALIGVTQGIQSPFIAGLWLEVAMSAMPLQLRTIVLVTAGAIAGLWGQQITVGRLDGHWLAMLLNSGFLAGMGTATWLVTWRWLRRQAYVEEQQEELGERLDLLNRELEDERVVSALGENVARLAHGLKNAVHSLRGFVSLIEPELEGNKSLAAVKGLRAAIDDLEELAHMTLGSSPAGGRAADSEEPSRASVAPETVAATGSSALERAMEAISRSHPDVRWEVKSDGAKPRVELSDASLMETLTILLRNAVEAMEGRGRGHVESWVAGSAWYVTIRDEGRGFEGVEVSEIFKPGFTTKAQGSGYGLFLAKRMLEESGGHIDVRPGRDRGATIEISLPLALAEDQ